MRADGLVWGTYIHGVFDQPGFRRTWLNRVRVRKSLEPLEREISQAVSSRLAQAMDRWADHVEANIDMTPIFSAIQE
jgi:adenosylcobyric acid synthase